ncbi:hypothetical protein NP233_g11506 [Leucocoprinus birnbaumii]|uniref:Uncharacterized protein n=1 Tax=Leucocoprinus birnbaumii TaxID=56174 RepID=A0AAD5VJZ2_9AGAR|nr:hypothetical protein NP233_g11506 [Leucocoprinus birnbaumii]
MVSPVTKSSCWRALEVLKLPINYPISLQNLRSIAEATPSLSTASLNIDLSIIPSFYATGPINHRLQTLITTNSSEDVHRSQRKKDRDEMEFMLDVVHHLDLLFPELKLLSSSPIDNFWNEAWKALRLCHKIREDEEGRKNLKS